MFLEATRFFWTDYGPLEGFSLPDTDLSSSDADMCMFVFLRQKRMRSLPATEIFLSHTQISFSLRHRSFSLTDTEIFLFQTRRPSPSDTRIFLSQTPDAFLSQTKCSLGEAPLEIKWSQAPNSSLRSLRRFMIAYAFTPQATCTCMDWQTLQV